IPGFSLPGKCSAQGVVPGHFPIENYANPFAPCFSFHRHGRGGSGKTVRRCKKRQVIAMRADKVGVMGCTSDLAVECGWEGLAEEITPCLGDAADQGKRVMFEPPPGLDVTRNCALAFSPGILIVAT